MKYVATLLVVGICAVLSLSFDAGKGDIQFVTPKGWPRPAYDFSKNKITREGFELGRSLFFDSTLSRDGNLSCGSCHIQQSAFSSPPLAAGSHTRRRNAPPLANLAWNTSFMWDGGINNLEVQPLGPITNPEEMNNTLENVVQRLKQNPKYRAQFYKAFGDSTITGQRVLKALAQFLLMFESFNSKYDKYVRNERGGAFTAQEVRGLKLFRENCATCHMEPLFTNFSFQNTGLGLNNATNDIGRMTITRDPADSLKFKVPSLRNVAASHAYMHDGRFSSLMQVLDHYTDGIVRGPTLAKEFRKPMNLSRGDKADIISFLQTLTDNNFLTDKRLKEMRQ